MDDLDLHTTHPLRGLNFLIFQLIAPIAITNDSQKNQKGEKDKQMQYTKTVMRMRTNRQRLRTSPFVLKRTVFILYLLVNLRLGDLHVLTKWQEITSDKSIFRHSAL